MTIHSINHDIGFLCHQCVTSVVKGVHVGVGSQVLSDTFSAGSKTIWTALHVSREVRLARAIDDASNWEKKTFKWLELIKREPSDMPNLMPYLWIYSLPRNSNLLWNLKKNAAAIFMSRGKYVSFPHGIYSIINEGSSGLTNVAKDPLCT